MGRLITQSTFTGLKLESEVVILPESAAAQRTFKLELWKVHRRVE